MNKKLMRAVGLDREVDLVEEGRCPSCEDKINPEDFRNDLSRKEFGISGLCQKCQDKVFEEMVEND